MQKDKDIDKGNLFLLVIPEKYKPIIFNMYHHSLSAGHQGPLQTAFCHKPSFAGFPTSSGTCAVLGHGCERVCALGSLLGSYVHQELTDVNNTNVFCCV